MMKNKNTMMASAIQIQMGDNTHHQDQLITPQSLSITKTIVKIAPMPIDELDVVLLLIAMCF